MNKRGRIYRICFWFLLFYSGLAKADFFFVQYNNGDPAQSAIAGSVVPINAEPVDLDWVLELAGNPKSEVVGASFSTGYCIRIHYGSNNAVFSLGNPNESPFRFEARQTASASNCSDESIEQLEFEIHIAIPERTRNYLGIESNGVVDTRVSMQIPGKTRDLIKVRNIQWRLEAKSAITNQWTVIGGLNLLEGFSGSGWLKYQDSVVRYVLSLSGDVGELSTNNNISQNRVTKPVEIQYGVKDGLEAPQGALTADGSVWGAWEKNKIHKTLIVGWNAEKFEPISMQLCADSDCANPLSSFSLSDNPFTIKRSDINSDEKVYFIVEWGDSGAALASERSDMPEVAFSIAPTVSFGNYQRPLTACVGHLQAGDVVSPGFKLRLGRQELIQAEMPTSIGDSEFVRIVFDKARDGTECPVAGLDAGTISLPELKSASSRENFNINVRANAGLFVGYAQLNGADYRSSLARWRETLTFYNSVYRHGRQSGEWMDGLVFGAGNRGGVNIELEPSSNFDTVLADESGLVESAKSLQTNTRVSSDFFAEQLAAIKEQVGDAEVNLVYFDDYPGGCGNYIADVQQSGLRTSRVLIISSIDSYTGTDALRSLDGGLAHLCEENERIQVYAFNWRERLLNLDWDRTLKLILEDWTS